MTHSTTQFVSLMEIKGHFVQNLVSIESLTKGLIGTPGKKNISEFYAE